MGNYQTVLITLSDLRNDLKAIKMGLTTDFSESETEILIHHFSKRAAEIRETI